MIQRSTRIYGAPRSGYFFEKSETEIGPINNILEEKGFSVRDLFNAMSKGNFPLRDAKPEFESLDNVETKVPESSENVWRLLTILKGDLRDASETYGAVTEKNANHFHGIGRKKRDVSDEEGGQEEQRETLGGKTGTKTNGKYTPVLKECNDAAASEVSDLNAAAPPVAKRRSSLREYNPRNGDPLPDIDFSKRKNQLNLKVNEESIIGATTLPPTVDELGLESPKESAKNETYINLKDHQLDAQAGTTPKDSNGYPIDIPAYNPDVIPYVDVPDYSDEREESLDKDDRRVAKEKYVEQDADVVDPEVPSNGEEKRLEEIIVREDDTADKAKDGEDEDENLEEKPEPLNEEEVKEQEETTISKGGVKEAESDDQPFDFAPINFDINEYRKPFNLEELFKDIEREAQTSQDQTNKTNGDVNEHQGSRNVPVRDDGLRDSGRYSEDGPSETGEDPVKKGNAKSEEINAAIDTRNFFDEFDKIFNPVTSEKPFLGYFEDEESEERDPASSSVQEESENPSEHSYGNEDTFERLFGAQEKRNESSSAGKTDDDAHYEERSKEDEADFFSKLKIAGSDSPVEPENDSLRDAYITLATIMAKKDDVSRLDEEVAEKAKKEGKMPDMYNNYWTLEYGTPRKQDER